MSLNPNTDMANPQGLDKNKEYEAEVVQNNDKEKHEDKKALGRIQIKVAEIFEGIKDEHLPWAIPKHSSADGTGKDCGYFSSPKVGNKVLVKFQDGSAQHPIYSGGVTNENTTLEEALPNYPDRKVHKLKNNALVIIDTKSNAVYIRNPGNTNIFILGDANLTVNGNLHEEVRGDRYLEVKGNSVENISGNRYVKVGGKDDHVVSGTVYRDGSSIHDGETNGSMPSIPEMPKWEGVKNKKKDQPTGTEEN